VEDPYRLATEYQESFYSMICYPYYGHASASHFIGEEGGTASAGEEGSGELTGEKTIIDELTFFYLPIASTLIVGYGGAPPSLGKIFDFLALCVLFRDHFRYGGTFVIILLARPCGVFCSGRC